MELAEQGREADVVLVDQCIYAGTWDIPVPGHLLDKLRELWETSKASKRMWEAVTPASNVEGSGASTPNVATSAPQRVH